MMAIVGDERPSIGYIVAWRKIPMSSITSPHVSGEITAPPEWQAIQHDVKCPLCDYNLRGLHEPRCPECGCQFDWPSVLDPSQRVHPWLFEHHPERSIRSYVQTLFNHLRPVQFWTTLQPTHRLNRFRLMRYYEIYAVLALLVAVAGYVEIVRYRLRWMLADPNSTFRFLLDALRWREVHLIVGASLLLALSPWFTFLALMLFQQSMRRSRIKASQVMRCTIYCGDVVAWYTAGAVIAITWLGTRPRPGQTEQLVLLLVCGVLLAAVLNTARLWIAYARYLRFKHALATVVAAQLIVGMTLLTIFTYATDR